MGGVWLVLGGCGECGGVWCVGMECEVCVWSVGGASVSNVWMGLWV